jgi:hypothetical protein
MPAIAFPAEPAMMRFRQTLLIGTGWAVFGLGVLVAPLPGPLGLPIMLIGGIILLRNSADVRRRFARMKRRPPGFLKPLLARFDATRMQARRKRRG